MIDYKDASWLENDVWGKWGKDDEIGALNEVGPKEVLEAVSLIKQGKVYDLEGDRFHGMPVWDGHPSFDLVTYCSPHGRRNMKKDKTYPNSVNIHNDGAIFDDKSKNDFHTDINTEILITPLHCGTHIDTLGHVTSGEDAHWYNGFNFENDWCDFGLMKADLSTIPPIILRGVLLDIAGYKGVDHVDANYGITAEDIEGCIKWSGVEIKGKEMIITRCGERWPEYDNCPGAGMTLEGARCLIEGHGAVLVGNDMLAYEMNNADGTMSWPGHAHPVHEYCLIRQGVHLVEAMTLDELAKDKVYEFCFILAPNKIKGGTGMYARPIAIV